jgi:tetratricopeptide (TPR) repeat protein/DNA-binding XRE family transcriptional regulator
MSAAEGYPDTSFGQMLLRYRRAFGLTQEELAERAGVSARTVSDLERGRATRPYRQTVGSLAASLGMQGPELDEFVRLSRQSARVSGEPRVAPTGIPGTAGRETTKVPRQLPAAVSHFAGRAVELEALTDMLGEPSGAGTVVISALVGTAGVGKSALAVRWAHQAAERFPDGQLYVNLRGYDPREPVAAADALAGLLRALGVPGEQIPDETDERARLYRSMLAGRRMLVLLDNAADSEQIRALLPGDPGCVAVVTSRDSLAGLVATDGARRLDLDVLPPADAVGLLRSLIGDRVDDDPGAAAELAGLCARLPLALRIAAESAAARPQAALRDLVAELAAVSLDGLDAGEQRASVRAAFSWSIRQLPGDAAGAFALLGLHPGVDLDVYAAAALTGSTIVQAHRMLGRLLRASLLQAAGPDRFGMHDLLRAYAREQAAARDADGQCREALTRLFDYYLAAAVAAMDIVYPAEAYLRSRVIRAATDVQKLQGEAEARAWLDAERANLAAIVVHCASQGWPEHTAGLAATLFRYLMTGSHIHEAQAIYGHALHAARLAGDVAAEAEALNGLGSISFMKGRSREAADNYQAALERYAERNDRQGQARALHNLGITKYQLHDHQSAADYHRRAMSAFEDVGDSLGWARALVDLAEVEAELGSYDEAAEHLPSALQVFRKAEHLLGEADALSKIGILSLRRSQLPEAAASFEQALATYRILGHTVGVAGELCNLGEVGVRQGEYQQAIGNLRQALTLFRQVGYQHGEILVLQNLADALDGAGQRGAADAELETALRLAAETGNIYQQASTHRKLAESHYAAGEDGLARRHWQQALDLYNQVGAPDAAYVRSRLNGQEATAQH